MHEKNLQNLLMQLHVPGIFFGKAFYSVPYKIGRASKPLRQNGTACIDRLHAKSQMASGSGLCFYRKAFGVLQHIHRGAQKKRFCGTHNVSTPSGEKRMSVSLTGLEASVFAADQKHFCHGLMPGQHPSRSRSCIPHDDR